MTTDETLAAARAAWTERVRREVRERENRQQPVLAFSWYCCQDFFDAVRAGLHERTCKTHGDVGVTSRVDEIMAAHGLRREDVPSGRLHTGSSLDQRYGRLA